MHPPALAVGARSASQGSIALSSALRLPLLAICLVVGYGPDLAVSARAQDVVHVDCPVVADTTLACGPFQQSNQSCGAALYLQARGDRSFILLRFDLKPAQGLLVTQATLRLRRQQELLTRVGVSTVAAAADWAEGKALRPAEEEGAACFNFAAYAKERKYLRYWAAPGGDFSDVVFGNGGSRWAPRVAAFDMASRWYDIDVPPELAQAMLQDLQPGGLCLSDDFGRQETAPTCWSRESRDPPALVVAGRRVASAASAPPTDVRAYRDSLGREWVAFKAPRALGFEIYLCEKPPAAGADLRGATKLDRWALPTPGPGTLQALLSISRQAVHRYVAVRTMEAAGEWSAPASTALPPAITANPVFTPPTLRRFSLPEVFDGPFTMDDGPALSENGRWIRSAAKTWWEPHRGPITLQAGRNEFLAFQVVLAGGPGTYAVTVTDWISPGSREPAPRVQLYRQHYVKSRLGQEKYAPDALVPLRPAEPLRLDLLAPAAATQPAAPTSPTTAPATTPTTAPATQPSTQPVRRKVVQGVWVELYVPAHVPRGVWRSRVIALRNGQALLDVPIELEVVDVALPDTLSFQVSLGSDRLPGQVLGHEPDSAEAWAALDAYYRTAHEHRATLAIVPYGPDGKVFPGFAPEIEFGPGGATLQWEGWDRHFGRYLDGSAFRDLPREAVPLDHFCLPFHENWPLLFAFQLAPKHSPLAGKYHYLRTPTELRRGERGGPRLDSYMVWPVENAFNDEYKQGTADVLRQFAAHLAERGWNHTQFQLFLNNQFQARESGTWWFLRDPRIHDDFLALRFWLGTYRQALADSSSLPLRLRADLGLPQFQRDTLDGLLDVAVMDETFLGQSELVLSHPERFPQVWFSSRALTPEVGWSEALKLGWQARLAGARGLVLRQSLGEDKNWEESGATALLYPAARFGQQGPYPSLRLKALRRVQQDMDWAEQWIAREQAHGVPEGYVLATLGAVAVTRAEAHMPASLTLLPVVDFPARLDTVALEELRRGLRQKLRD